MAKFPVGAAAPLMTVDWDNSWIRALASATGTERAKAGPTIIAAHNEMAKVLQDSIVRTLQTRISEHGRGQRGTELLVKALQSSKMRTATTSGFSIGGLEQFSGVVRLYARNLEVGTDVFLNRPLLGFISAGGSFEFPRAGDHADPRMVILRRGESTVRQSLVRSHGKKSVMMRQLHVSYVRNPIQGYFFFRDGTRAFREDYGTLMLDQYAQTFAKKSMDFYARLLSRYGDVNQATLIKGVTARQSRGRGGTYQGQSSWPARG